MHLTSSLFFGFMAMSSAVLSSPIATTNELSGFKFCSKPNSPIYVKSIAYTAVDEGKPVAFSLKVDLSTAITQGAVMDVKIKTFGYLANEQKIDLCSAEGVKCPILPGQDITLTWSEVFPSELPFGSGLFGDVSAVAKNADGTELLCMENPFFRL